MRLLLPLLLLPLLVWAINSTEGTTKASEATTKASEATETTTKALEETKWSLIIGACCFILVSVGVVTGCVVADVLKKRKAKSKERNLGQGKEKSSFKSTVSYQSLINSDDEKSDSTKDNSTPQAPLYRESRKKMWEKRQEEKSKSTSKEVI